MAAEAGAAAPPTEAGGRVVALQANYCLVSLDAPGPGGIDRLLCTRRTRLGKAGKKIHVGDRVDLDGIDWAAGRGAVAALQPRTSLLQRPAVANCDRIVVSVALAQPGTDPLQLSRFLLTAEATGRPVELVFTKADLATAAAVERWCARVRGWGYDPVAISVPTGEGLEILRRRLCRPGIAVLCGPSGVGKSSLLNALLPALELRVGTVSGRLQRGRHTTRHVELFPLAPGALIADTPGFNRPDLPGDAARLAGLFPEIRAALEDGPCRFSNCQHRGDPGCRVGTDWDRFAIYAQCLEEALARSAAQPERGSEGLRQRGKPVEPQLDRRLRQPSRRRQRQQDSEGGELESGPGPISPPDPAG